MNRLTPALEGKTVGVMYGGRSPEHEISIVTGCFIVAELRKMNISTVGIYVDREGQFYCDEEVSKLAFFKDNYTAQLKKSGAYNLDLQNSKGALVLSRKGILGKSQTIDFVFPAFHGNAGEDGSIQGMLEFFGVPYAGCGIYTSSVAIDKALTKDFFKAQGLPHTKYLSGTAPQKAELAKQAQAELTLPVFVKPARAGSSIGISRVTEPEKLNEALDLAFYYDHKVVVEEGVPEIKDLTCAVMSDGVNTWASEVQESVFADGFLNYDDKYLSEGGTQTGSSSSVVIPAQISDEQTKAVQTMAKQVFENLGANGMLRVDFLLNTKDNTLFANEINTLPGTLYHHLWEKTGQPISDVLEAMIIHGIARSEEQRHAGIDFSSNVLNEANSLKLQH